jgi:hypothetical protein
MYSVARILSIAEDAQKSKKIRNLGHCLKFVTAIIISRDISLVDERLS